MRLFGFSLFTLLMFALIFVIGAKYGSGIVAKIPIVNSL